ncbi:B3 domain-containing transcription repressor VAL1-like [Impatiens glandulifera]|uniref:B3 domain-containing transcription repressor VAL1-like n=1 Tax=Impatiens glandulifera TaxID=253017 RepID=UPI001FB11047|nr:B3 domain-containing transcription repressor VAL1-like [Impatiens glandulifera]
MATICMNEACKSITTLDWKKGWSLKSGGLATLCYNCGSVYESLVYCETFHPEESGWRECRLCGKRIHCGCIASKSMHEYLDTGGVGCIGCVKSVEAHSFLSVQMPNDGIPNGFSSMTMINNGDLQTSYVDNRMNNGGASFDMTNFMQLSRKLDSRETDHYLQPKKTIMKEPSPGHKNLKHEEIKSHVGEVSSSFSQRAVTTSSLFPKPDGNNIPILTVNDLRDPLSSQPSLHFSLGPLDASNVSFPVTNNGGGVEGREQQQQLNNKVVIPFQQAQKSRQILPKLSKSGITITPDTSKGSVSQTRVPRPPAEGRGRNQLLPRYWPRITDQELQKISGDLNSTILPLFEKVLSASDAGRIGRLVLPKACAEAYFPSISQSEGIPIKIQDVKGKEWTFQFRFWPNNNSRMYVLEGVTPCIQNMQLQAGDTVTFSRLDPGGKLVIGFRKSATSVDTVQDGQTTPVTNGGAPPGETVVSSCANDSSSTPALGGKSNEESSQQPGLLIQEKKKSRNIGLKSKRLLMRSTEAMELKLTWEEAQELLRPSTSATRSIVMIDDQEFEEYDEPPVFGKRTVFTARLSGEQEQWTQCDSCWKWRRLPVDALLPVKWTCADNVWDQSRCLCSAADEINAKEMESLLKADFKKRKISETNKNIHIQIRQDQELSGLEALATAAVLGDNLVDSVTEPSSGPTTKHPRHRDGCSCIVCIQPPSGKGKHKPTCMCNVCLTVKRRFKTLMLRKKKRQSERDAETGQGKELLPPETEGTSCQGDDIVGTPSVVEEEDDVEETTDKEGKILDLNSHPNRDDEILMTRKDDIKNLYHPRSESLLRMDDETTTTAAISRDQENEIMDH